MFRGRPTAAWRNIRKLRSQNPLTSLQNVPYEGCQKFQSAIKYFIEFLLLCCIQSIPTGHFFPLIRQDPAQRQTERSGLNGRGANGNGSQFVDWPLRRANLFSFIGRMSRVGGGEWSGVTAAESTLRFPWPAGYSQGCGQHWPLMDSFIVARFIRGGPRG